MFKKYWVAILLISAIFISIGLIFIIAKTDCLPDPGRRAYSFDNKFEYEIKYTEEGKSIGRSSILLYLIETNQLKDSAKIDLYRVICIEDSISKVKVFNQ